MPQATVSTPFPMATPTKANSSKTWQMEKESSDGVTAQKYRGLGGMTNHMDSVKKNGLMGVNSKGCLSKGSAMARGGMSGRMAVNIRGIGREEEVWDMEGHIGRMDEGMRDSGSTIRSMEEGSISGRMAGDMRVITKMGSDRVWEPSHFPTESDILENGPGAKDTERAQSLLRMEWV